MSKHTPRPWDLWDYGDRWLINNFEWGVEIFKNFPEHHADARLIATAPELLESLKDVMEYIGVYAHPDDLGVNSEVFRRACVVIAKAEGADNE